MKIQANFKRLCYLLSIMTAVALPSACGGEKEATVSGSSNEERRQESTPTTSTNTDPALASNPMLAAIAPCMIWAKPRFRSG